MMQRFPFLISITMSVRNLRSRPARTLLTIMGITLGVAVVLAIEITNVSTLDSLRQIFDRTVGKAELLVIPPADEETLDEDLLTRIRRTPGVKIAAPTIWIRTALDLDRPDATTSWGAQGVQVGRFLELRGIDPELDAEVRYFNFSAGRFPIRDRYEVVLPASLAEEKEVSLGDDWQLLTPTGVEKLEIVGLVTDEGAALINDGAVAFTSFEVLQEIYDVGSGINEVAVQVERQIGEDPAALAELKDTLAKRLAGEARTIYPAARGELVPRMLDSYQIGLMFFSIIAVFVGAFLIYNTFSMTVVERTREIGMLRAIGMSRRQILSLVLTEAGILSILGSILGVLAGVLLARGLILLLGGFIAVDSTQISVTRQSLLFSVGVGMLVTFASALLPAVQAAQISPLEALRSHSQARQRVRALVWVSGGMSLFIGWAFLYRLPLRPEVLVTAGGAGVMLFLLGAVLSIPLSIHFLERAGRWMAMAIYQKEGRLGSANIRRSVIRTMLTVACLMIALVMIIGIGTLSFSFKEDVRVWVNNALGGDIFVRAADPLRESFAAQLLAVPGVQVVSPARFHSVRVAPDFSPPGEDKVESLIFTALQQNLFRQVGDMEFLTGQEDPEANWARLSGGSAVFISSVVADEFDLEPGDTLPLLTRRGEHPFTVAAVTTDFTGQGFVVNGTYEDLNRWFGESGVDRFTLVIDPEFEVQAVAQDIEDRFQDRYNITAQTTDVLRESVLNFLDQLFLLFDVLSMIGLIIGALGVVNTLTMNVLERQREIGSLRSLGMTQMQVVRMVLAEALALGTLGGIYGLVFGLAISKVFLDTLVALTSYEIDYRFSLQPYLLGLFVTLLVTQIAAFAPARRAARTNMVEALKHE